MEFCILLITFVLGILATKSYQSHKVDNTIMYRDDIGFTMADGKKENAEK